MLNTSWSIISAMMDQESVDKITMLKKDKFKVILDKIPAEFLEEKYGGKLKNLKQFW